MSDGNNKLPDVGFAFWPVGCGDSTTISVNEETFVQVDLRHMECAEDEDDERTPVVDRLVKILPKKDGKPFLSLFVLTHPDKDHCCGFKELLRRVTIGELWHTPRIFREYKEDLCEDAVAFREEAHRRAKLVIDKGGAVRSGDRLRLVGYDDLLQEEAYQGFPKAKLTIPGTAVTEIDGVDQTDLFRVFIHAPFKDDADGDRNDTSLAMQVTVQRGEHTCQALLLGDLSYPIIKRIFDSSEAGDLKWDVLLAPHHCSKSVMYWKDEGEDKESLKQGILDAIERAAKPDAMIVASCDTVPETNKDGDNPPHAIAKARYEEIAEFLCTGDRDDAPIIFALEENGLERPEPASGEEDAAALAAAVPAARGAAEPPKERIGFGRHE
jgi:beta-lactamase superfamily II metal-dependent hydrolase